MTRPFRFAVQAYRAGSAAEWRGIAQRVEALGYSTLHVADHYIGAGPALDATGHRVQTLACIPAMTYAAASTTTLRIGSRMLNVGYHVPAVLAKEVASIDVLSEGRLELGLGAGWLAAEYEAMGIPFGTPGERITLLEECVEVIRQACAGQLMDFSGTYVSTRDYTGVPASVQTPHPPIMIGGGAPRILRYAGRVADIVSVNFNNRSGQVGGDSIAHLDGGRDGPEDRLDRRGRGRSRPGTRARDRDVLHVRHRALGGHRRRRGGAHRALAVRARGVPARAHR